MQYLKFRISDYRAITEPLEIDLDGNSLIPIIGINESGKTTILHAILAFDAHNDNLLHGGQQLKDMENLYELRSGIPTVAAQIAITAEDYNEALDTLRFDVDEAAEESNAWWELERRVSGR